MSLPIQRFRKLYARPRARVGSGDAPREGAIVEVAVPSSCFAFVEGPTERSPALVTRVLNPGNPHSCISCLIMEAGMTPEDRVNVHYGYGEYQWHWPTKRSIGD
jgi:hypothetical protein